jgi:xylan 1,4-beta-xylosidase
MKAFLSLVSVAGLLVVPATTCSFPVTVTVDAVRDIGSLPPIWRFFGADEPNYATAPEGEKLLAELGSLRPGEVYFRAHNLLTTGNGTAELKWGSTHIYTERGGKPVYDFTIVDHIIDTYLARGIHPYLEIGFMPQAMTSAPADVPYHRPWREGVDYKGAPSGWSYPPQSYAKWAELIYQWTRHNVERYGRAEVERWYFEVWNEPNLDFYWNGSPEDFYRLHDFAIEAVRRALPKAQVGGPDVAGAGGAYMDGFLRHITSGVNYATGKTGTPADFLSFHAKGEPVIAAGHVRMGIAKQLQAVNEAFSKIAAIPALAHTPIVIGENDPEGCAACTGSRNAYRNDTVYSSYTAEVYARLWEIARLRNVNLRGALTWAFTFVGHPWFAGYRQLATHGVDLPVLNVFRLLARLSSREIEATSTGEVPLEQIVSGGVRDRPDVGVLATRAENGQVDILLWHYRDDDVPGPPAKVHVILTGLTRDRGLRARIWRVDHQNGDAFTAWKEMGSPDEPTPQQVAELLRAAHMMPRTLRVKVRQENVELETRLPLQGVELIELLPQARR